MGIAIALHELTIVAATALEANAVRRECPGVRVVETGVALAKLDANLGEVVVSCGLAGGLHHELPSGAVVIPREVRRPNGETMRCDDELVEALARAARSLGAEPVLDSLLTADELVVGEARAHWAARGHVAVDMETGRLQAARIAAVRVILDTPRRELSADWLRPARALRKPKNWRQALWLARNAPRCARLAARVVAAMLASAQR